MGVIVELQGSMKDSKTNWKKKYQTYLINLLGGMKSKCSYNQEFYSLTFKTKSFFKAWTFDNLRWSYLLRKWQFSEQ